MQKKRVQFPSAEDSIGERISANLSGTSTVKFKLIIHCKVQTRFYDSSMLLTYNQLEHIHNNGQLASSQLERVHKRLMGSCEQQQCECVTHVCSIAFVINVGPVVMNKIYVMFNCYFASNLSLAYHKETRWKQPLFTKPWAEPATSHNL